MTDSIARDVTSVVGSATLVLSLDSGAILTCDAEIANVTGYVGRELESVELITLVHPEDQSLFASFLDEFALDEQAVQVSVRILSGTNDYEMFDLRAVSLSERHGERAALLTIARVQGNSDFGLGDNVFAQGFDLDPVTGLYRESYLMFEYERIRSFLGAGLPGLAMIVIEIDRFQSIEDSLGQIGADAVLSNVSHRIDDGLGTIFPVARLDEEQFGILALGASEISQVDAITRTLRSVLDTPVIAPDGEEVVVTACVGVAFASDPSLDARQLFTNASIAKDHAKAKGSGKIEFFQETFSTFVKDRRSFENIVRRAIDNEELVVLFQPIMSLSNGRICGVEALVRMNHPSRGLISPIEFISVAKEIGRLPRLGTQVATQAVGALAHWQARYSAIKLSLGINLSGDELEDTNLVGAVLDQIDNFGIKAADVSIELGNIEIDEDAPAHRSILRLHEAGVRLSVDEFGVGSSALGLFTKYQVSQVKIDRTLMLGVETGSRSYGVLNGLIKLAHSLDAEVVGIGVEKAEQIRLMRKLGIDKVQGYHIGAPMERGQIETHLELISPEVP